MKSSKTANGATHNYVLDGTKILRETWNGNVLTPLYDNEDSVLGILYNNTPYYFQKNLQGDVIAILDQNAQVVVRYSYDAWGMPTILQASSDCFLAITNPYLYRSYYYDWEIGKYYLQSRYYDPVVGRFINGDEAVLLGTNGTALGYNLFAYCGNNSISRKDITGQFWISLIISGVILAYLGNSLVHSQYNQINAPNGFIYNQNKGKVANLRFGFFKSSYNGCGWIATYNALKLLGKTPKAEDIISEYELTGAVLFGVFGIHPYAVSSFFSIRGYKVTTTYNPRIMDHVAKTNTANILFYWHNSGAHYIALHWNKKQFIGYNTFSDSSGPDNLGISITKKFNENGRKAGVLISISNK